jgi:hypothetical protein
MSTTNEKALTARTPAQLYALTAGTILVATGIVGYFYNATFSDNAAVHDDVFGILAVNGWANVLHIVTGAFGLIAAGYAARAYALGLGVVYVALTIWGFLIGNGDSILSIVPVNTGDDVLHLLIGLAGIAAWRG